MSKLFSKEWMQVYLKQWNAEPELGDAIAKIQFNSTIASFLKFFAVMGRALSVAKT